MSSYALAQYVVDINERYNSAPQRYSEEYHYMIPYLREVGPFRNMVMLPAIGARYTFQMLKEYCGFIPPEESALLIGSGFTLPEAHALAFDSLTLGDGSVLPLLNRIDIDACDPEPELDERITSLEAIYRSEGVVVPEFRFEPATLRDVTENVAFSNRQYDTILMHRADPEIFSDSGRKPKFKTVQNIMKRVASRLSEKGQIVVTIGEGNDDTELLNRYNLIEILAQGFPGFEASVWYGLELSRSSSVDERLAKLSDYLSETPNFSGLAGVVLHKK
ncbi:hypothetical protein KBD81_00245 [Candidatus Woesebacteria bacterium]|nr:hypothetical protein [Candidatus Woesebacteria bacterium]